MYKSIRTLSLFAATLLVGYSALAQDNVIDEVIWVVGDEAILKSQVEEQRISMTAAGEKINGDPYCTIPEQIALQKLFLHQANLDSIVVPETSILQQVDAELNYYISQIGSKEKLEEYFNKSYNEIREVKKDQVRDRETIKQVQKKIVGTIKVTPSDVRRYFETVPKDSVPFIPTRVEAQIVVLEPRIPQKEIDAVKDRLRDYADRVNKGESEFSTLAVLYSEDAESAKHGGELGFMGKGQLVPEFANVAFNLQDPKKVSKVVETEYGFHIIQLIEKRGDRVNCRHILLKPKVEESAIKEALLRLDSISNDLKNKKFTFDEAAQFISMDKDTRNNNGLMLFNDPNTYSSTSRFEMQQLPPEVARVIEDMNVGDISKPFRMINKNNKEVCAIVKLKSRVEGHKANASEDYQALKQMVEEKKRNEIIQSWIKKKITDTYIRIKPEYNKCKYQYSGWVK
ncbi:peptidylprolyl isomerase [Parabacteroides sp. FAFU027]|uniref:peptidylprolyl isomerase n=1 Tax=Parabacteroides sp. FAFU027 TaxID=2922715 RepID=UPI001FAF13D6|nr:peptidylprolyl isomerase [Parabacteroides sp. FAFU027]